MIFNGFVQSVDRFADRCADQFLADLLTDLMMYMDLQCFSMVFYGSQWFVQSADRCADRFADVYGFAMLVNNGFL